jgi:hypothetical protein
MATTTTTTRLCKDINSALFYSARKNATDKAFEMLESALLAADLVPDVCKTSTGKVVLRCLLPLALLYLSESPYLTSSHRNLCRNLGQAGLDATADYLVRRLVPHLEPIFATLKQDYIKADTK